MSRTSISPKSPEPRKPGQAFLASLSPQMSTLPLERGSREQIWGTLGLQPQPRLPKCMENPKGQQQFQLHVARHMHYPSPSSFNPCSIGFKEKMTIIVCNKFSLSHTHACKNQQKGISIIDVFSPSFPKCQTHSHYWDTCTKKGIKNFKESSLVSNCKPFSQATVSALLAQIPAAQ